MYTTLIRGLLRGLFCGLFAFSHVAWAVDGEILVFAGAGMRLPLEEIGSAFEAEYGIAVAYDFEGSGRLGNKILAGQRPDVFIPASERWAALLKEQSYAKECVPIAFHIPVILTPMDATKVERLQDFTQDNIRLVLGDPNAAAIGSTTEFILEKADMDKAALSIVARGITVKQLVQWMEMNMADASIIWKADAIQSGKLRLVPIPEESNVIAVIPVCEMTDPLSPDMAEAYRTFLVTDGKRIFEKHGFSIFE